MTREEGRARDVSHLEPGMLVCYYYFIIFFILLILFYCCTRSKRGMEWLRGGGNDESGPKRRVLRRLGIGKFFLSCFIYTNQCFIVYIDRNL